MAIPRPAVDGVAPPASGCRCVALGEWRVPPALGPHAVLSQFSRPKVLGSFLRAFWPELRSTWQVHPQPCCSRLLSSQYLWSPPAASPEKPPAKPSGRGQLIWEAWSWTWTGAVAVVVPLSQSYIRLLKTKAGERRDPGK